MGLWRIRDVFSRGFFIPRTAQRAQGKAEAAAEAESHEEGIGPRVRVEHTHTHRANLDAQRRKSFLRPFNERDPQHPLLSTSSS